jgi:hypothetical protein
MWGTHSDERTVLSFTTAVGLASVVILGLSQIQDSSNLEGQDPIFVSLRKRVTQLYPQAMGSFFVPSYDSQCYVGGIRTRLHKGMALRRFRFSRYSICVDPTENIASHNSSTVPCITVASLTWCCLVRRNLVTGIFSG